MGAPSYGQGATIGVPHRAGRAAGVTMSTTLVKNGTVITASDRYDADVYVDKGVITLIGQGLNLPADTVVDASGKLVLPGGIDVHTHLDMPFGGSNSADDFESGTIAAAHGGTTTVVDFAIQNFGEGLYPEIGRASLGKECRSG